VEMWVWLRPAWIMLWTLIQRDGHRLRVKGLGGLWALARWTRCSSCCSRLYMPDRTVYEKQMSSNYLLWIYSFFSPQLLTGGAVVSTNAHFLSAFNLQINHLIFDIFQIKKRFSEVGSCMGLIFSESCLGFSCVMKAFIRKSSGLCIQIKPLSLDHPDGCLSSTPPQNKTKASPSRLPPPPLPPPPPSPSSSSSACKGITDGRRDCSPLSGLAFGIDGSVVSGSTF